MTPAELAVALQRAGCSCSDAMWKSIAHARKQDPVVCDLHEDKYWDQVETEVTEFLRDL